MPLLSETSFCRGLNSSDDTYIAIRQDTANWCTKTAVKSACSLFLHSVSDYKGKIRPVNGAETSG